MYRRASAKLILLPVALAAALAGCASQPAAPAPVVRPTPNVYFYPLHGQTAPQQDRDRYECYRWAHRQTGYDPSLPRQDGAAAVQVVAGPPPGYAVAAGAATGAMIGAAVTAYRDAMKSCLAARGYSVQ